MPRKARILLSISLCLQLLAPAARANKPSDIPDCRKDSVIKECKTKSGPVIMDIGQPSIWSLAQAHYFLTQMHESNRSLHLNTPGPDQLDPNKSNASRLEILRTLLQVDAGYDQSVGLKNQVALQHYREKEERKVQAQIQVQERQAAARQLDQEILELKQQIAVLTVQDGIADKARGDAPPSDADRQRKERLASLKVDLEAKQAQRTALQAEIDSLNATANADVATPEVNTGTPPTSSAAMTSTATTADSTALKDFAAKAVGSFASSPTVAASVALDNYLGMQYEIIAKQLTLLRDEAGPDERIVFLELPTSIYTVDRWANNLIAQVKWKVTRIYDEHPSDEAVCRGLEAMGRSQQQIARSLNLSWSELLAPPACPCPKTSCLDRAKEAAVRDVLDDLDRSDRSDKERKRLIAAFMADPLAAIRARDQRLADLAGAWNLDPRTAAGFQQELMDAYLDRPKEPGSQNDYPITLGMIVDSAGETTAEPPSEQATLQGWKPVRTIEIIPRQSALNINEYQGTTNNTGILGLLKLLSGFGAQVNYQRQHEVYQNLLQQEVYASGFGKGTEEFGWTFGPLPGSKRIAPGQRTTYAVLVVPKNAQAVQVEATGWAFPRSDSPIASDRITSARFLLSIPSETTNRFWIDSVSYVTVLKGRTVTALIKGSNFSPQLGALVNGITLKKSLSIARVGSNEEDLTFSDTGVHGEFELINSGTLALRFSMGKDFVGTPIITLVTPERTDSINGLPLWVNRQNQSLDQAALREPMFSDDFKVDTTLEEASFSSVGSGRRDYDKIQKALLRCKLGDGYRLYRLTGTGLRPNADIAIDDTALKLTNFSDITRDGFCENGEPVTNFRAAQENTRSYLLYFKTPTTQKWKVRYRQPTRLSFDEFRFDNVLPAAAGFKAELRNYRFNRAREAGEAELTLSFPKNLAEMPEVKTSFDLASGEPRKCEPVKPDQDGNYRVHCEIPAENGERDFVSFEVRACLVDEKKNVNQQTWLFDQRFPVRPRLESIRRSASLSGKGQFATLRGVNLHKVTGVLFGDQQAVFSTSGDPDFLVVTVPPREVPAGAKENVPVIFQTDGGPFPTGFTFEYAGPPLPKRSKKEKAAEDN